jgi:hypothetical protein
MPALLLCALSLSLLMAAAFATPSWAATDGPITGRLLGNGNALAGRRVQAISTDTDAVVQTATTTDTGRYTFDLPAGSYLLRYVGNSHWAPEYYDNRLYQESAVPLTVVDGATTTADDAELARAATISGKVTTLSPDKPVGLSVEATNFGTGQVFGTKTSSTGTYTVKGLPEGPYIVTFGEYDATNALLSAPEIYNNVHEGLDTKPNPVWVTPGEAQTGINAALERGATISGKVIDKFGAPVAGCPVDVSLADRHFAHRYRYTKADGSFSVVGLGQGKLTLAVGDVKTGDTPCGLGTLHYDGDDVLSTTPSPTAPEAKLGLVTTLGATTDAGTLVYTDTPVTETPTTPPSIKGTPNELSLLTADEGAWNLPPTSFSYAWLDNGAPIAGATTRTYRPPSGTQGHRISVTVTAHKKGVTDGVFTTPETPPLGEPSKTPVNTVLPTFSTPKVGVRITANPGTWNPSDGVYTYQWRNGNEVLGTATTLVVPAKMARRTLTLRVVARNDNPTPGVATSKGVVVRPGTITVTKRPSISGTARVGRTLKYVAGRTSPSTTSRTYRWLRDGRAISGATRTTRTLTSADRHHKISLRVTYRKTGYTTVASTTAQTRTVS